MRLFLRVLALLLLAVAIGLWLRDLSQPGSALSSLGEVWYTLDPPSLNLVQAVTERYLSAWLWDPVLLTVLLWPAALVFTIIGAGVALLALLSGRRHRERA